MSDQKECEDIQLILEAWKKTIDVQQHFNDLELRIRNFAVTLLVAVFGLAGIALQNKIYVTYFSLRSSIASWLLLAGLIGWVAFYFMDRFWYHRLLIGSVEHGEFIEKSVKDRFPSIALTMAISAASPSKFFVWSIHSSAKIHIFYLFVCFFFLIAILAVH